MIMKVSRLFIDTIIYPENLGDQNLFTIIAPSFKSDIGLSFFAIPFSWYISYVQKENGFTKSKKPKLYVLDVSIPYGELNGWPKEELASERNSKIRQLEKCLKVFDCKYEVIYLEKELGNSWYEKFCNWLYDINLDEMKNRIYPMLEIDDMAIEAARKASYETRFNLPVSREKLIKRFKEYEVLRKTEYSLITRKYNAITIKQSDPLDDEPFDVSIYEEKLPRIYLRRPKGGRMFRPKENELRLDDNLDQFLDKLSDTENLEMAAVAAKAYEGVSLEKLESWIKKSDKTELKEAAKKAWRLVAKVR